MLKITGNVSHDGKQYFDGDILSAEASQEQTLVDLGVGEFIEIEAPIKKTRVKKEKEVETEPEGILENDLEENTAPDSTDEGADN